MKVIIGVNGTPQSESAASFAARLMNPARDELVLYFSPPKLTLATEGQIAPDVTSAIREAFVRTVFERARAALPEPFRSACGRVSTVVGSKEPAHGLLLAMDQHSGDLLVVAADSQRKRLPFYLSGVARTLSRQSTRPILVVRRPEGAASEGPVRVLYAHDGSPASRHAEPALSKLHWPANSVGYVARVLEWLDLSSSFEDEATREMAEVWRHEYEREMTGVRQHVEAELSRIQQSLPPIFHRGDLILLDGHRVQSLCDVIRERSIDLIVVGARNLGPLRRLLGSTTEGILQHAPCSCLIVHDREQP